MRGASQRIVSHFSYLLLRCPRTAFVKHENSMGQAKSQREKVEKRKHRVQDTGGRYQEKGTVGRRIFVVAGGRLIGYYGRRWFGSWRLDAAAFEVNGA